MSTPGASPLPEKQSRLNSILAALAQQERFALAFSGGLDSRFLAHAAQRAGLRPLLLHIHGPHISTGESAYAASWAKKQGMDFRRSELNPLNIPQVANNDLKRCYFCKRALFTAMREQAAGLPLCDGTHASDSQGYRPGLAALRELGILSPLADAALSKSDIRSLAESTGLDDADQRPRPCLLTRLDYGQQASPQLLQAIERGEESVSEVLQSWWLQSRANTAQGPDFRLRQVREGFFELHLSLQTDEELPQTLHDALASKLKADAGLELFALRAMPSLSGYFDQKRL